MDIDYMSSLAFDPIPDNKKECFKHRQEIAEAIIQILDSTFMNKTRTALKDDLIKKLIETDKKCGCQPYNKLQSDKEEKSLEQSTPFIQSIEPNEIVK